MEIVVALKNITESPKVTDTIRFVLRTPDANGRYIINPYKVTKVILYFIARNFTDPQIFEEEIKRYDPEKLAAAEAAEKTAAEYPTPENIQNAQQLRTEAESSSVSSTFYYNQAIPVAVFGDDVNPAWLREVNPHPGSCGECAIDNPFITNIPYDDEGNQQCGVFEFIWNPIGQKEGQYFICWYWQPNIAGNSLSAHEYFELFADTRVSVAPSHRTASNKYETLLRRYLPDMFRKVLCPEDLSPTVLNKFNLAVAKGFTVLEDFAVQLIDLLDANIANENSLSLLANMFNLRLKSNDPTLWRRQIRRAIPVFKKKGTLDGLKEAYANAGMMVNKVTRLWQVISPYTWAEAFNVTTDGQTEFTMDRNPILPIDITNFEIYLRPVGDDEFIALTIDYVDFSIIEGQTIMTWLGNNLSLGAIVLVTGDTIKVVYKIRDIPAGQQSTENYIRLLPLADQRDDRNQQYPLKNWNVRVIEEDDPMIDVVIPTRHPYENAVIFGKVRTEFPFSENVYNMDEWNGSLRDSSDPCDIDKDFLDCCTACLSSKFNIDVEIGELSDERIYEANQILEEMKPFHAILHSMNIMGSVEEFVNCNEETLEVLIAYQQTDNILTDAQVIFSRVMEKSHSPDYDWNKIRRDALNDLEVVGTSIGGTGYNTEIVLYAPYVNFLAERSINNSIYLSDPSAYVLGTNNNRLEILPPSSNAGEYVVSGTIEKHMVKIDQGIPEPLSTQEFAFRLSNIVYSNAVNNITGDPLHIFVDSEIDFIELGVVVGWKIEIGGTKYDIVDTYPNGSFLLSGGPSGIDLAYKVYNSLDELMLNKPDNGTLTIQNRAIWEIIDPTMDDIRHAIELGDFVVFGGNQYQVIGFVPNEEKQAYIDYSGPNIATNVNVYRRIVTESAGYVGYKGMTVVVNGTNYESDLSIVNGASAPGYPWPNGGFQRYGEGTDDDRFKENLLIRIDDTEPHYFTVADIKGENAPLRTTFTLSGEPREWETTGTPVTISIYRAVKKPFSVPPAMNSDVPGYVFETPAIGGPPTDGVDRRGKDIINYEVDYSTPMTLRASILNSANRSQPIDTIAQDESITFNIEYADGTKREGKI